VSGSGIRIPSPDVEPQIGTLNPGPIRSWIWIQIRIHKPETNDAGLTFAPVLIFRWFDFCYHPERKFKNIHWEQRRYLQDDFSYVINLPCCWKPRIVYLKSIHMIPTLLIKTHNAKLPEKKIINRRIFFIFQWNLTVFVKKICQQKVSHLFGPFI
jgi:hypothetical protein